MSRLAAVSLTNSEDSLAMPRHRLALLARVILIALASIQLTGCTAIGFGLGAIVDASRGGGTADRLRGISTGTHVTLVLNDGQMLHGKFQGSADSLSETPPPVPPIGRVAKGPIRAVLLLGAKDGIHQIPTHGVSRVSVPDARGKGFGALLGLIVDSIMVWDLTTNY
jgi:hypothetical protein